MTDAVDTTDIPDKWRGILCVEGVLTGDNRFIEVGAVDYARLPVPLRFVQEDVGAHDKAQVSGRIDEVDRITDPTDERLASIDFTLPEGAAAVWGEGPFDLEGGAGSEHARQVWRRYMNGVSVDLDDVEFSYRTRDEDGNLSDEFTADPNNPVDPSKVVTVTKHARLRAATGVAIPAFADANIVSAELVASGALQGFFAYGTSGFIVASGGTDYEAWRDQATLTVDIFASGVLTDHPAFAIAEFDDSDLRAFHDYTPVGTPGGKQNWLDEVGGLPAMMRDVAHALIRSGHTESQAIQIAVGTIKRWAKGVGKVTAKTREKAQAAVVEWEAKKAKAHATTDKHSGSLATFAGGAPGVLTDGSSPQCHYCDNRATGYILHAEGMAFIPFCPDHADQAKFDGEHSTPDGSPDPSNIVRIGDYTTATQTFGGGIGGETVIAQVGDAQLVLTDGPGGDPAEPDEGDDLDIKINPVDTGDDSLDEAIQDAVERGETIILVGADPNDGDFDDGVYASTGEESDEALAAEFDRFPGRYDFRALNTRKRRALAKQGHALADGSFPIESVSDLDNAIQSIGRAKKPSLVKAFIRKRAKELGAESHLPDSWASKDRSVEVGADMVLAANLDAAFAYNPLQWRNPENGKWIDMPTSIGNRLTALFKDLPTMSSPNGPVGQYQAAAADFDQAVQAGDFDGARAALDRSRRSIVALSQFLHASKDKRAVALRDGVAKAAGDFTQSYKELTDGNLLATLVENRGEEGGFGPGFDKSFDDPERTAAPAGPTPDEPRSAPLGAGPGVVSGETDNPVKVLSRESHDAGTVKATRGDELSTTSAARNLNEGDVIHTSHGPSVVTKVEGGEKGQTVVHTRLSDVNGASMGTGNTIHVLPSDEHVGLARAVDAKKRTYPKSRIPGVSDDEYAAFLDSPITSKHIDPETGDFTTERKTFHEQTIAKFLDGIPEQDKPVQWMNGGGPASGKGGMVKIVGLPPMRQVDPNTGAFVPSDEAPQALLLDPDAMKAQFPEVQARLARFNAGQHTEDDLAWAGQIHEESSYLAKQLHETALAKKVNVLYDGTGDSGVGSVQKKAKKARDAGYSVEANYLTIDPEEAFGRAKSRAERTGRGVPDEVILNTYANIPGIFAQVKDDGTFDKVSLYFNGGERDVPPVLVGEGDGKSWTTHDEAAWDTFIASADKARALRDGGTVVPNEKEAANGGNPSPADGADEVPGEGADGPEGAQGAGEASAPGGEGAGGSEGVTGRRLIDAALADGGASIKFADGSQPDGGYMVSREDGPVYDLAALDDAETEAEIEAWLERLHPDDYAGVWVSDDGKVYFDASENVTDLDEAKRLGAERNQRAVWDVTAGEEIDTGGTGAGGDVDRSAAFPPVGADATPEQITANLTGHGWQGTYPNFTRTAPDGTVWHILVASDGSATLTSNGLARTARTYPTVSEASAAATANDRATNPQEKPDATGLTAVDGPYSNATMTFDGTTEGYAMKFDANMHWRNPRNGKFIDMPGTALKALASAFGDNDDTVSGRAQRLIRNIDADIQAKHWERVNPDIQLLHRSHELEKIDETITPGTPNYTEKSQAFSHLDDVLSAAGEAADYETFHTPFLDRVDQHDDEPDEPEFDNPEPPKFDNPSGDFDEPEPTENDQPSSYERDTVIPGTDTTWGEYIDAGGSWNNGQAPTPEEVAQVIAAKSDGEGVQPGDSHLLDIGNCQKANVIIDIPNEYDHGVHQGHIEGSNQSIVVTDKDIAAGRLLDEGEPAPDNDGPAATQTRITDDGAYQAAMDALPNDGDGVWVRINSDNYRGGSMVAEYDATDDEFGNTDNDGTGFLPSLANLTDLFKNGGSIEVLGWPDGEGGYTMTPNDGLTASAAPLAPPAAWFDNPKFTALTPLTITDDGRVFGHLAGFSQCHLAAPAGKDVCVTAPRSGSNYSLFHLGDLITAEGSHVAVGKITMDTGHAGAMASSRTAIAHYDNTGAVVADVRAGEDRFGIWLAGAVRSDVPDEKVKALRAAPLSGDWRRAANGALELVAALAVNMPGFPIPRPVGLVASGLDLDGDVTDSLASLVAAGIVTHQEHEVGTLSTADAQRLQRILDQDRRIEAAVLRKQVADVEAAAKREKIMAFAASQKQEV